MYHMKNIIIHDGEIPLPKCMYRLKNPNECLKAGEIDINISNQVIKFLKIPNGKMAELEERQDQLLKKLDILYDRIKTISSICNVSSTQDTSKREVKQAMSIPEEIVVALSPDNLPWFLNVLLKEPSLAISSVPNEKVPKIKAFVKKLVNNGRKSNINLRLIFQCVSADAELKLSSLAVPIVGTVNILRYVSFAYPSVIPYDCDDYYMDSLLDLCHLLERAQEKNRDGIIKKLFSQHKDWLYKNQFSIVDLAAYNVVKQWQNSGKYVPKTWFDKCEKMCL